jgi:hypothetical protein
VLAEDRGAEQLVKPGETSELVVVLPGRRHSHANAILDRREPASNIVPLT